MKHSEIKIEPKNDDQAELVFYHKMKPANWIVSYPRSGNTFVRSLVANYFSELDRPLGLEEISESTRGEHNESIWTDLTGKRASDRTPEEEWRVRQPYFTRLRNLTNTTMPLIKSHTVVAGAFDCPAFQFMPGDRIIHIVRHPCDVVISYSHFNKIGIDEAIDQILTPGLCKVGHPDHGYEFIGSWPQHTRSWMQELNVPVHRIRYTDLVARPVDLLMDIVEFLNCVPRRERAALAVEFSSHDRLQSEEKEKGFSEASKGAIEPFFREGRPGQWLDVLTINQAQRILNADSELIDHFGFMKLSVD